MEKKERRQQYEAKKLARMQRRLNGQNGNANAAEQSG
jgi:hypothetical protein